MYSSNLIFSGISEGENEEGPERYRRIIEAIANTMQKHEMNNFKQLEEYQSRSQQGLANTIHAEEDP